MSCLPFARFTIAAAMIAASLPTRADPVVDSMATQFVAALPVGWTSTPGAWEFLDVVACHAQGDCHGNNPTSPYGYPTFGNGMPVRIGPSEAIVVFMRTPSPARYFGFTQYLNQRGDQGPAVNASLGDTLNHLRFSALGAAGSVFDRHAVLVWTADGNTLDAVQATLAAQGIPAAQVNVLPMPIALPLRMGDAAADDSFTLLMRIAIPEDPAQLEAYRAERPFAVVKVAAPSPPPVRPLPPPGFANEVSGVAEDPVLAQAVSELVADLRARYRRTYKLTARNASRLLVTGFDCIDAVVDCAFDNHDALYANNLGARTLVVQTLRDVVFVVGANHRTTGKAVYFNHSVSDPERSTGIVSVDDTLLTPQSALYHAGVRRPTDPRVERYRDLYAYAVSYDCAGLNHCLSIPAPTATNPVGLPPGAPFSLWMRTYVDPLTGVRPSDSEVSLQQVLVGTPR